MGSSPAAGETATDGLTLGLVATTMESKPGATGGSHKCLKTTIPLHYRLMHAMVQPTLETECVSEAGVCRVCPSPQPI